MTRYAYLIPAAIALLCTFVVKAFRWQVLLRQVSEARFGSVFPAVMIGYFSNYLLPLNAGELVRAFVLGREKSLSNSTVVGTIVVERMLDVLVLTVFLVAALLVWPSPGWLDTFAVITATIVAGGWFVLWLMLWQRPRTSRIIQAVVGRFSPSLAARVKQILDHFLKGVGILHQRRTVACSMALSLLLWSFSATTFCLVGKAIGLTLPAAAYSLPVAIVNLGMIIPALPGRVGTLEALIVTSLALFSVESDTGLAFDVVMRVLYILPTLWGWFFLYRTGLHVRVNATGNQPVQDV
jgi:uncharacterized protein (TIRG00374 family)